MSRKRPPKSPEPLNAPQNGAVVQTRVAWSGPLPPPSMLKEFDNIVEDGAKRIFEAWESETSHRRLIEIEEMQTYKNNTILGRVFSFIFVMSALGLAAYMATIGYPWSGVVIGGGTIASVVWAFNKVSRDKTG